MPNREFPPKFQVAFSFAGEQRRLVRSIAEAVEQRLGSSSVFLDEWFEHYIAGDDADLKLMNIYGQGCELVVVCVSESYGNKPWTKAEHGAIRARRMKAQESGTETDDFRILPIRVGDGDIPGLLFNAIAPDVRGKPPDQIAEELIIKRLRLIVPDLCIEMHRSSSYRAWPNEAIPFEHGLADRTEQEWPAVLRLLTIGASKRILMFKGPSGFSKTVLLAAAGRYAKMLKAPVAYIDFKDTANLDQANMLAEIRFELIDVLPGLANLEQPSRWELLEALRNLSQAALIVLDVYEKVKETKDLVEWIETRLLAEAEKCETLRFLIGGQEVPDFSGARWRDLAEFIELDRINDERIWTEWIHQFNPDVDDKHIEGVVRGLEGIPKNISEALAVLAKRPARSA